MRLHVFGDTGGHATQLLNGLKTAGVDLKTLKIAPQTRILHVGDLIHKGPDSEYIVSLVHTLMERNPGQWIQLLGNHEFQHIGGPQFWDCDCSAEQVALLNYWYETGLAKVAYGSDSLIADKLDLSAHTGYEPNNSSWLFTHAGLTQVLWEKIGQPETAENAAQAINNLTLRQKTIPGSLLFGGSSNKAAGPVWAVSTTEVFSSWEDSHTLMPFNQVYGHTTPFAWMGKNWYNRYDKIVKQFQKQTKLNPDNRTVITKLIGEMLMVGVDPGFSGRADIKEQPHLGFTYSAI